MTGLATGATYFLEIKTKQKPKTKIQTVPHVDSRGQQTAILPLLLENGRFSEVLKGGVTGNRDED